MPSSLPAPPRKKKPPSKEYHHGDLRNALLQAADEALATQGYAALSLSNLARSLNVTPAAAYKHFADKSALLAAIATDGFDVLAKAFEQVAPSATPAFTATQAKSRLARIAQAYFDFGVTRPGQFQLMFSEAAAAHRRVVQIPNSQTPTFGYLTRALDDLSRLGVTRAPSKKTDAWLAWSLVHGATHLAIAQLGSELTPSAAGEHMMTSIIAALGG